jgi:hypothetical protein
VVSPPPVVATSLQYVHMRLPPRVALFPDRPLACVNENSRGEKSHAQFFFKKNRSVCKKKKMPAANLLRNRNRSSLRVTLACSLASLQVLAIFLSFFEIFF